MHSKTEGASRKEPKTTKEYDTLRAWLASGKYSSGDKFPSERSLTEEPGIDRTELRQVLARLISEGALEVRGRSSYRVPEAVGNSRAVSLMGGDPADTALRETVEETGWRPKSLEHVLSYQPMVGMVDSPHEIFVGHGAEKVGEPTDLEEAGHIEWVPLLNLNS
ncbi:GntR family transcriptional regulator [Streptomyces olivaceus]|nr:GntR family transcriptional regulator [Streptomyces olivaceus]